MTTRSKQSRSANRFSSLSSTPSAIYAPWAFSSPTSSPPSWMKIKECAAPITSEVPPVENQLPKPIALAVQRTLSDLGPIFRMYLQRNLSHSEKQLLEDLPRGLATRTVTRTFVACLSQTKGTPSVMGTLTARIYR